MSGAFYWQISWQAGLAAALFGYLVGSIPFGLILTRAAGLGDIRKIGSGNIGATNVLRTGNRKLAAATLVLDALKATLAALVAGHFGGTEAGLIAGALAFVGHIFPVWLGFAGGKGVATFLGVLIGIAPPAALAFAAIWLATAFASRYSSLSALLATLATPFVLWLLGNGQAAAVLAAMTALCWWRHRENIARLIAGTEGRIGQKG